MTGRWGPGHPKARGPEETPDKPEPDKATRAAGRIKCGVGVRPGSPDRDPRKKNEIGRGVSRILRLSAENLDPSMRWESHEVDGLGQGARDPDPCGFGPSGPGSRYFPVILTVTSGNHAATDEPELILV